MDFASDNTVSHKALREASYEEESESSSLAQQARPGFFLVFLLGDTKRAKQTRWRRESAHPKSTNLFRKRHCGVSRSGAGYALNFQGAPMSAG